jgi:hypothetical protein
MEKFLLTESTMPDVKYKCTATLSGVRVLGDSLRNLWRDHPDWVMTPAREDVIYSLPLAAIDDLAWQDAGGRAILIPAQAAAERVFTAICADVFAIGTRGGEFIRNTPLDPRPRAPDPECMAEQFGRSKSSMSGLATAIAATMDTLAEQRKGYTGWLLTEPLFLAELDQVRVLWSALPARLRPDFPLLRPAARGRGDRTPRPGSERLGPGVQAFGDALVRLLDKYGLISLATWDLPVPQGPLLPNLLPPGSPAQPRTGVNLHVPNYLPMPAGDAFDREVARLQQQTARDLGIGESGVGLPRHEAYSRLMDVLHLERSIRARLPGPPLLRGDAGRIVRAIAKALDMKTDRVEKYRKAVTACRAGRRAQVAILRAAPTSRRPGSV